jgi:hypothetical protein
VRQPNVADAAARQDLCDVLSAFDRKIFGERASRNLHSTAILTPHNLGLWDREGKFSTKEISP